MIICKPIFTTFEASFIFWASFAGAVLKMCSSLNPNHSMQISKFNQVLEKSFYTKPLTFTPTLAILINNHASQANPYYNLTQPKPT